MSVLQINVTYTNAKCHLGKLMLLIIMSFMASSPYVTEVNK